MQINSSIFTLWRTLAMVALGAAILAACTTTAPASMAVPTAVDPVQEATLMAESEPTATPEESPATPAAGNQLPGDPGGPGRGSSITAKPAFVDVAYADVTDDQTLDIYLPEGDGPFPTVIAVHGGAFKMGDKTDVPAVDALLARGYAVVSVNYRLSGTALFPAQIQDVKTAVRFIRARAGEYGINPDKIGAWGPSAGGNLVSLLGTSCGVAELEGAELGYADQSSCVSAVVDWFGPIDFSTMQAQFEGTACNNNTNDASSPESQLIGAPVQEALDKVRAANPITYITAEVPPFLIQHGTADCNIPPAQSQGLYDALSPHLNPDEIFITFIEGAGHGGEQFDAAENVNRVIDFLDTFLK